MVLCGISLAVGFLWRIGYEFHVVRSILARARYLTIYRYEISLESKFWRIQHGDELSQMCISGSFPRVTRILPLNIHMDWISVLYQDDSFIAASKDFSNRVISLPSLHPWVRYVGTEFLRILRPCLSVNKVESTYTYFSSILGRKTKTIGSLSGLDVDINNRSCKSGNFELVLANETHGDGMFRDYAKLSVGGPCECRLKRLDEVDVVVTSIDISYFPADTLSSFIDHIREYSSLDSPISIPSRTRVKCHLAVREKIHSNISFEDKCSFQATMNLSHQSCGRRLSSLGNTTTGLFISAIVDPFSLKCFKLSIHQYANKGKNILFQALVRGVSLVAISCSGCNVIGDLDDEGTWNLNCRTNQIAMTLLDKTGSTADSIVMLKNFSVSGTETKGISVVISQADLDISARMLNKAIRVYLRLMTLISGPAVEDASSFHTTPIVSSLLTHADPNFALLQKKYWSSMSSPSTPPLNESMSTATPAPSESMSRSTSSMSVTQADSGNVKNWRAMERIMFEGGKVLMSFAVDQIVFKNKDLIQVSASKLKTTSKISSTGSPFTTVCCDGFAVNDNVIMNGGLRIWIDGNVSSELSRVFCLVPPISIRFDSKFAEIVETYFLELVEVLNVMNRKNAGSSSAANTKQFIEFLQISSLQLELHAKEMLGVLALDKAMINLTRSSVYRSNGVWGALKAR